MTTPTTEERPAPLPVPGALQVALTYDVSGQPATVVFGCGGPGIVDATASTATALAHAAHTLMRPLMATSATLTQITAREAVPDGATYALALPASNRTGTAAGNLVTAYATLVRWGTTQGGRSGRGRTFVPAFTTGGINADGRTLSSTYLTAAAAFGAGMVANTADVEAFSIVSKRKGDAYSVESYSVSSIVGVQRRRLRN